MEENIILFVIVLLVGMLFYGIGCYAQRMKSPMHFYSGSTVDASALSDVKSYNQENGRMWKIYSLGYLLGAVFALFLPMITLVLLLFSGTAGLGLLVVAYQRIYKKYSLTNGQN